MNPVLRPPTGSKITVTFPGTIAYPPETVTGTVAIHYTDGFDVIRDDDDETFTLYDVEQADGRAAVVTDAEQTERREVA